ncbi:thioesterase II family protein [Catellatospora vulcania]|uniref:thioesterase II family protein n=1 Tax=Catellatospora vulcania TaxID=1460450 RepID=UPI0012D3D4E2|nr:alpha/beta fold hydrolase [Catellatospora vulcania]
MTTVTGDWIRTFHPAAPGAVTLVCLPHAGGAASFWFPLSRALAPGVAVAAVQYPGRQDRHREPLISELGVLADRVAEAVAASVPGPLALFGHSMGAVVGYEVALRLRAAGRPDPVMLFASGRRAPSCYRAEDVHRGDDNRILSVLRELAGTHADLLANEEVTRLVLPSVRSDYQAVETYRHDPAASLTCPVTVLTGSADPLTSAAEAVGWQRHTTGPVEVLTFPGGHFFLVDHAQAVVDEVHARLDGRG